jgi:hypothetical protein
MEDREVEENSNNQSRRKMKKPKKTTMRTRGLYIGKYPSPPGERGISADVIWRKKYENGKRKRGKCKKKEEMEKKREERGRK